MIRALAWLALLPRRLWLRYVDLPFVENLIADEIARHEKHKAFMQMLRAERAHILDKINGRGWRGSGSWRKHKGLA